MTSDQKAVLTIVGSAGGKIAKTSAALASYATPVSDCVTAGWLVDSGGFYLMGTVGEKALATALAA